MPGYEANVMTHSFTSIKIRRLELLSIAMKFPCHILTKSDQIMQSVDLHKSTSHSTYDVLSVNQVLIQVVILHAISILMVLLLDIKSSYITEHICSVISIKEKIHSEGL